MRKITIRLLTRLPTKYITSGLILVIILFAYGIAGSYFIMKLNFVDSVYYAVITMATVGYGDYLPTTGVQKIFATTLALSGVAVLAYVFNVILSNFQEKVSLYSKGARKLKTISKMDDYYVLCGFGRVGKVVFEELTHRNQNVIVIDKNAEAISEIEENDSVVVINEDATETGIISRLASDKCNSVIISTGDDVSNIFIVLTIREVNPDTLIVSRASKLENISRLKKAGADKIVSPELIGGQNLYIESTKPHILRITVKHGADDILKEFETIIKHDCTLENIDYHLPGIETPLTRDAKTKKFKDGVNYMINLKKNPKRKKALENLYENVNNIHSHLISGPDKKTLEKLVEDLKKQEEIIGINLKNSEIAEITNENLK